jgi:hypothetical protein
VALAIKLCEKETFDVTGWSCCWLAPSSMTAMVQSKMTFLNPPRAVVCFAEMEFLQA